MVLSPRHAVPWLFLASALAGPAAFGQEVTPRVYYGARLEPRDKVIAGAGQDREGWESFAQQMAPGRMPIIYMSYTSLKGDPASNVRSTGRTVSELEAKYPGLKVALQIGLSMTRDGSPEQHYEHEVAAGKYDAQVQAFAEAVKALNRPVFIRIGYEFDAEWNGYQADTYKQAFVKITKALRAVNAWHATVWCSSSPNVFWKYYPGDEWVDWWATDMFAPAQVVKAATGNAMGTGFMDTAHARCKPVLIGESTARAQNMVNSNQEWDTWFGPYFNMLKTRKEVKAFGYINWDWSRTTAWATWGDARIQTKPEIAARWREEMKNDLFLTQAYSEANFPRQPSRTDCVPAPLPDWVHAALYGTDGGAPPAPRDAGAGDAQSTAQDGGTSDTAPSNNGGTGNSGTGSAGNTGGGGSGGSSPPRARDAAPASPIDEPPAPKRGGCSVGGNAGSVAGLFITLAALWRRRRRPLDP